MPNQVKMTNYYSKRVNLPSFTELYFGISIDKVSSYRNGIPNKADQTNDVSG